MGISLGYCNPMQLIIPHVSLCFSSRVYKYEFFCVFVVSHGRASGFGTWGRLIKRTCTGLIKKLPVKAQNYRYFVTMNFYVFLLHFFKSHYNKVVHQGSLAVVKLTTNGSSKQVLNLHFHLNYCIIYLFSSSQRWPCLWMAFYGCSNIECGT